MGKINKYPAEVRERAVALVLEHQREYSSLTATVNAIAPKFGMTPETLRVWTKQAQVDHGLRPGQTTDEKARIKELERENRELRRANEILRAASAFFARELDPQMPKR